MPAVTIAVLFLLLGSACAREDHRSAAQVEAAVEAYLAERTDLRLGQLRVRADHVRYQDRHAVAEVSITAPGDPKAAMKMVYELRYGPDGWQVVPAESSGHAPAERSLDPYASPPLPPGHPPTRQPGAGLPPGHPPLQAEPNR